MRLSKFLIAGSAIAAAAALAVIPAAQANNPTGGPIASIHLGSTTSGSSAASLTLKTASVTMDVFGSPTTLTCSSGSATGTANAGSSPVPSPFMTFASLTLACDSFLPGQTVTMSVPSNGCANLTMADSNVHDGLVDTGPKGGKFDVVDGSFNVTGSCVVTVNAGICSLTLGGITPAQIDEFVKPNGSQDLILKGNGLQILTAPGLCGLAVSVGDPVTLNNVVFNMTTAAGNADFRQTAP